LINSPVQFVNKLNSEGKNIKKNKNVIMLKKCKLKYYFDSKKVKNGIWIYNMKKNYFRKILELKYYFMYQK